MNYKPLVISLYQIGAIKFGDFTLKSGKTSKIYLDLRQIISHPPILKAVGEVIWHQMSGYRFEVICGVPYTALPIATCISLQQEIPMVMRRKEPKAYGTKQTIDGHFNIGQQCLIIEDVITSGSSILETANDLEVAGLKVKDIVVLIDREEGGKENLQGRHYALHAAMTLKSLLNILMHAEEVSENDRQLINQILTENIGA